MRQPQLNFARRRVSAKNGRYPSAILTMIDGYAGFLFECPYDIAGKNMRNPEKIREDIFKTGGSSGCTKSVKNPVISRI